MSKQSLLLVDGDTRSLRVLEVSLRKAGFTVTPAVSVVDALDKLELHTPDLIICETKFPSEQDGFELRKRLRSSTDWAEIPFVFLTAETAIENKIRGLELGVDDYLTKPIYIKEIVTRINIMLQKRQRANFDERKDGVRFAGRVADMPVVDVIQTIEVSRKSGVIQFVGDRGRQAAIYFRDGRVIDAEAGTLQGEDAVYRLLTWNEGEFEVVFRTVRRREAITTSSQGLLMEGMRRLDEWSRLLEQLPPLAHRFEVDTVELAIRLGEVPDDNNRILRLIDGKRSVIEVIDASDFGDLECLQAVSRLYFEGLLIDLDPDMRPRRDTGKPVPLVVVDEVPTPIEEVASGPIMIQDLARRSEGNAPPAPPRAPVIPPVTIEPATEVDERAVLSEEPADRADDLEIQGPLTGGYRPSSLRLIDEAVAAAQAIEPSLFDDVTPIPGEQPAEVANEPAPVARVKLATRVPDPRIAAARALVERMPSRSDERDEPVNGEPRRAVTMAAVAPPVVPPTVPAPPVIPAVVPAHPEPDEGFTDGDETEPGFRFVVKFPAPRDESKMKMIGSHGRDRAEASGELIPPPQRGTPISLEAQRELVTIMPRRTTRELAVMVEGDGVVEQHDDDRTPPPTPYVEVEPDAPAAPALPVASPPPPPPPSPSPPPPPPRRVTVEGATPRTGPGPIARTLAIGASLLAFTTVYLYCHGRATPHETAPVVQSDPGWDAAVAVSGGDAREVAAPLPAPPVPAIDAAVATVPVDAPARVHDAAIAHVVRDAAEQPVAAVDAGEVVASRPDAAPEERVRTANELIDKGHAALEDGDPETALAMIDRGLQMRHSIRGYLERARALQRLDRIDAALESIGQALALDDKYAPSWELKGRVLWAVRRYEEARAAFERFLELDPNNKSAPSIRHLLEEPR